MENTNRNHPSQNGASLIIALIMLLLLTIIGLSAMQGSTMQEKMVGNMRDTHIAFHAAEIVIDYSESWIDGLFEKPDIHRFPCSAGTTCMVFDGQYKSPQDQRNFTEEYLLAATAIKIDTWTNSATRYGDKALQGEVPRAATDIAGVMDQPLLLVEYEDFTEDSLTSETARPKTGDYRYVSTVRASGASDKSEAIIETHFVRRFD